MSIDMQLEGDDRTYWEQMRLGDKQALFELYNSMYFHLIRFGLKINADDELVKDCVNQVFLNLWDKRSKLVAVDNVKSYLMTSLKRCMLDQLSYLEKMTSAVSKMGMEEDQNELSYEEIIIKLQDSDELQRKLRIAIQKLTPRQMELIRLRFFEGLTYEEIAEKTSQNVKTSYNTIYDAIKM
ncbi:MAG: sigma-70 family RNA polymerase sigma factor, partial [Pedobacter sp.]